MSTDRELLELAAKAAGIGGGWGDQIEYHNGYVNLSDMWILESDDFAPWNPLTDDGDALRLAVKLRITIEQDLLETKACAYVLIGKARQHFVSVSGKLTREEATRRAITRAAAEIGRRM